MSSMIYQMFDGVSQDKYKVTIKLEDKNTGKVSCPEDIVLEDYDSSEAKILNHGGKVALPKYALPGMAWQGYYLDTEGNTFGVHQPDENAK